jgi:hypothetical protein
MANKSGSRKPNLEFFGFLTKLVFCFRSGPGIYLVGEKQNPHQKINKIVLLFNSATLFPPNLGVIFDTREHE